MSSEVVVDGIDLGIDGLSRYREIGSGGFATVYAARDAGFRRWVAVKTLHTVSQDGQRRFERELAVMGSLGHHEHVVTPYRSGVTNTGAPFLVMEYLRGGSLEQLLSASGPIPAGTAIDLVLPIADALGRAHGIGILHRDVKPANILLTVDGSPKLSDFGIAAVREATATQKAFTLSHTPPETFAEVERRDERSDLYSLASTLYTLVAGDPPFTVSGEESLEGRIGRIVTKPVPTLGLASLDEFLAMAMAKSPEDRFPDAAAFAAALTAAGRALPADGRPRGIPPTPAATHVVPALPDPRPGHPVPAAGRAGAGVADELEPARITIPESVGSITPMAPAAPPVGAVDESAARGGLGPPAPRLRRRQLVVAAVIAIAGLGGAVSLARGGGDPAIEVSDATVPAETASPGTALGADGTGADEAGTDGSDADGSAGSDRASAEATGGTGEGQIDAGTGDGDAAPAVGPEPVFTGHTDFVDHLAVLPDDRIASGGSEGSIYVWDPAAPHAEPLVLGGVGTVFDLVTLPDGRVVSGSSSALITVWDPTEPLSDPIVFVADAGIADLAVLPDGRIASAAVSVEVWDPAKPTDEPIRFDEHGEGVSNVEAFEDGRLVSAGIDGTIMVWEPEVPWVRPIVFTGHTGAVLSLVIMPDGRVATGGIDGTVRIWDPSAHADEPIILAGHTAGVNALVLLPDGRLASGSTDDTVRLWNPDGDGADPVVLRGHTSPVWSLTVAADGRIASASYDGTVRLWDPTTPLADPVVLTGHTDVVAAVDALSDGRVVSASHDTTVRVWLGDRK